MSARLLSPLLATFCLASLAACGQAAPAGRIELLWPERAVVYRVTGEPGRIEAYSIRNGIAPLGTTRLPAGLRPAAMALDAGKGRIIVWGERGGAVIDGRTLALRAEWHDDAARPDDVPPRHMAPGQPALARTEAMAGPR